MYIVEEIIKAGISWEAFLGLCDIPDTGNILSVLGGDFLMYLYTSLFPEAGGAPIDGMIECVTTYARLVGRFGSEDAERTKDAILRYKTILNTGAVAEYFLASNHRMQLHPAVHDTSILDVAYYEYGRTPFIHIGSIPTYTYVNESDSQYSIEIIDYKKEHNQHYLSIKIVKQNQSSQVSEYLCFTINDDWTIVEHMHSGVTIGNGMVPYIWNPMHKAFTQNY